MARQFSMGKSGHAIKQVIFIIWRVWEVQSDPVNENNLRTVIKYWSQNKAKFPPWEANVE